MRVQKKDYKYILLLVLLFGLAGCSSKKSLEQTSYSVGALTDEDTVDANGKPLASCTPMLARDNASIGAKLQIYQDQNGDYDDDRILIRITSLPQEFEQNSNQVIRFFRWKQDPGSEPTLDSSPLRVDIQTPNGIIDPPANEVRIDDLQGMRYDAVNMIVYGTSLADGFQVIQMVLYDEENDTNQLVEGLIPYVHAHPLDYFEKHSQAPNLRALHPHQGEEASNTPAVSFARQMNSAYCF